MGGSSGGLMRGFFGGTKSAHVDPRFASDRDGFRLEWTGEWVLVGIVESEGHLVLFLRRLTLQRSFSCCLFLSRRSAA